MNYICCLVWIVLHIAVPRLTDIKHLCKLVQTELKIINDNSWILMIINDNGWLGKHDSIILCHVARKKHRENHTTRSSDEPRCHGIGLLWDHHFHTFSGIFVPGKAGTNWGELTGADSLFVPGKKTTYQNYRESRTRCHNLGHSFCSHLLFEGSSYKYIIYLPSGKLT